MKAHPQLDRYILPPNDQKMAEMISFWSWLTTENLTPVFMTKFGDWFLANDQSRVLFLDLLEGNLRDLGISTEEIQRDTVFERFESEFSVGWIEVCLSHNLLLAPNQCYGWKVPPLLGGEFSLSNIQVFGSRVYQSLNAQIHQQLSTSPEGRKITGFTVEE
jgi:hypothetical protein